MVTCMALTNVPESGSPDSPKSDRRLGQFGGLGTRRKCIGTERKTALAPTVDRRARQDAQRRQRSSPRSGIVARATLPLLGLVVATLMCPAPALAGAYTASGSVEQTFYPPGPPGVSNEGPAGATFRQEFMAANINLVSAASSSAGNLSLYSLANINLMTNWDSGNAWSRARAGIVEPVSPDWASWLGEGETFVFDYQFSVSGNLLAESGGPGAAGGSASLEYSYAVGDSHGGGNWSLDSAGNVSKSGVWNGVVSNSFTVDKDSTFALDLRAAAGTWGGKAYNPESNVLTLAIADFGHTLTWLGITGMRVYDDLGSEVDVPPGAYLPLIGLDSGVDYWYSAAPAIPEPSTALLFGCGLVIAGLTRKSALRRRDS